MFQLLAHPQGYGKRDALRLRGLLSDIAIISISQIDLLILDEPTNNLDIETVDQMIEGINEYQGALWVISHDLDFLSRINITQAYKLSEQALQQTIYLPTESELYYQELVGCQDG
jgi:ATPase subunit of ABC transporter with duplicated ATPase domains